MHRWWLPETYAMAQMHLSAHFLLADIVIGRYRCLFSQLHESVQLGFGCLVLMSLDFDTCFAVDELGTGFLLF